MLAWHCLRFKKRSHRHVLTMKSERLTDRMLNLHPDWLIPDWPAPPGVHAVFTSRAGGISPAPWDSMNLGNHVGDEEGRVSANRNALDQATGADSFFLKQVHGTRTIRLTAGMPLEHEHEHEADACVTSEKGIGCTMMVADCLPILLASSDGTVVAAAHAGWRGLAGTLQHGAQGPQGVIESVFKAFDAVALENAAPGAIKSIVNAVAWLGPCIGPSAFEVGPEVKAAFEVAHPETARFFKSAAAGKYLCDLAGLARHRLERIGVRQVYGNDGGKQWCTVSNPRRYFSHRRDTGTGKNSVTGPHGVRTTGRMAACIWLG